MVILGDVIWWLMTFCDQTMILFKRPLIVFVKSDYILYQSLLNFAVASPGLGPNETNHATAVYSRLWIIPLLVSTPIAEYCHQWVLFKHPKNAKLWILLLSMNNTGFAEQGDRNVLCTTSSQAGCSCVIVMEWIDQGCLWSYHHSSSAQPAYKSIQQNPWRFHTNWKSSLFLISNMNFDKANLYLKLVIDWSLFHYQVCVAFFAVVPI